MYSILMVTLFGLLIGLVARYALPGHVPDGRVASMLMGVFGAFCGDLLGGVFGLRAGQPGGFLLCMLGAILVVAAYQMLARRRHLRLPIRHASRPV